MDAFSLSSWRWFGQLLGLVGFCFSRLSRNVFHKVRSSIYGGGRPGWSRFLGLGWVPSCSFAIRVFVDGGQHSSWRGSIHHSSFPIRGITFNSFCSVHESIRKMSCVECGIRWRLPCLEFSPYVYFFHGKCCHSLVTCCLDWFERFQVGSLARISWDLENDIPWEGKKENWNRFSSKCTGHWLFVHGTNCVLYSWFVTSCLAFSFSLLLLFVQKEKVQVHDVCFVMDSYLRVSNSPAGRDKIFRWVWHSFFPLNLNHKLSKSGENNHESFPRLNTLHPWNTLYMLRFVVSFVPPQVHSVHVQVSALVAWRWSEECSVTGSPNTSAGSSHESFAKRFVDYRQVV